MSSEPDVLLANAGTVAPSGERYLHFDDRLLLVTAQLPNPAPLATLATLRCCAKRRRLCQTSSGPTLGAGKEFRLPLGSPEEVLINFLTMFMLWPANYSGK